MELQIISNQLDYKTFREIERDGKSWFVVNAVPVVEGVLNKFLVPYEEFGAFPSDWNGMPLVINHPQENNGSARVSNPDVPVVGRFYNAEVDPHGRRLLGEFWLDKVDFLNTASGPELYEKLKSGQPVEISTGYYAPNTEAVFGNFKGKSYAGIHKGIRPDHIAILTNELGACSIMDGCGMNRNTSGVVQNCGDAKDCKSATCPMKDKKMAMNHYGPGNHKDGSSQDVHGGGKKGGEAKGKKKIKIGGGSMKATANELGWSKVKSEWGEAYMGEIYGDDVPNESGIGSTHVLYAPVVAKAKDGSYHGEIRMMTGQEFDYKRSWVTGSKEFGADYNVDPFTIFSIMEDMAVNMGEEGVPLSQVMQNADALASDTSAMIALMLPEQLRAEMQAKYPFMDDETRDSLHITIVYLGDNRTLNAESVMKSLMSASGNIQAIKGKFGGIARFVGDDGKDAIVLTYDSPAIMSLYKSVCNELGVRNVPYHKDHGFTPHMTIGYIAKDAPMPVDTMDPIEVNFSEVSFVSGKSEIPSTLNGGSYDAYVNSVQFNQQPVSSLQGWLTNASKTILSKEKIMKNLPLFKAFLNALGFNNVTVEDKGADGISVSLEGEGNEGTLEGLVQVNSLVQNAGGVVEFSKTFSELKKLPSVLAEMQVQLNSVIQHAQSVASKEATRKATLVAGLVQNSANPFDEATLNSMSVEVLEKLDTSYQPVDFSGLGAGLIRNSGGADEKPLALPKAFLAEKVV